MSREIDGAPDYRAIQRQKLYDLVFTVLDKNYSTLTDGQLRALAAFVTDGEYFTSYVNERGWPLPGADAVVDAIKATEIRGLLPEAFATVPTKDELTRALIAAEQNPTPTTRANIVRAVDKMGLDERLQKSVGIDMTKAPAPKPATAQAAPEAISGEERRRGVYSPLDRHLEERGYDMRNMRASKRAELHRLVEQEMAPKKTPALDELRTKLAVGGKPSNTEKINAAREATAVFGKTLRELGLPI